MGRRRFLKSLFGLGTVGETTESAADAAPAATRRHVGATNFFWANLQNGQIGFPTGMAVPRGMPGSVMKLITGAALRESGIVTDHTTVECRGTVEVHREKYSCLYPHGHVDLTKAIGLSCNVFFATMSAKLNGHTVLDFATKFGLSTAIADYGTAPFPTESHADVVALALGLSPEVQPNALQLLRVAALVALHGKTPPLHNAVEAPKDSDVFSASLSPSTWMILQQGMRICGREGTAKSLDIEDKLKGAFKTGTSPHGKAWQSWIVGYFPYEAPRYAFALRSSAGTSVEAAVPEAQRYLLGNEWP